jgi:hypothetical protein
VAGERARQREASWLGERVSIRCPPGVRYLVGSQSTADRERYKQYKVVGVLGKYQGCAGEARGELARAKVLVLKPESAIGQLGYKREREGLGLARVVGREW